MFIAAFLFLLQTPAAFGTLPKDLNTKEIPRFQMISAGLYRGGQPDREGFQFLKESGFKTVINLRTENDEESIVKELGLNYVHIPISIKMWSRIPSAAIDRYFAVLSDPSNYPIFFHCRRGADRTGALAGFYRIAVQGWEPRKAYSEAREVGMRWWYPAIKKQLENFKHSSTDLLKTVEAER